MGLVAGREPGLYRITDTGQLLRLSDSADIVWYDSELLPSTIAGLPATITAGWELRMFVNPNFATTGAVKQRGLHYNITEWGKIPKNWDVDLWQIGFRVEVETTPPAFVPADDNSLVLYGGHMRLVTGGTKDECDGKLINFPSGYGIGGSIAIDGNAVPVEVSALTNGVPSPGAVGRREIPIPLPESVSYEVIVRFPNAITLRPMPIKRLVCELTIKRGIPVR